MGDPTYKLLPEDVRNVAVVIKQANDAIDSALNAMELKAEAQMAEWHDNARDQYKFHKAQWDAAIKRMSSVLSTNAAPALNSMVDNVEGTEYTNMRGWS